MDRGHHPSAWQPFVEVASLGGTLLATVDVPVVLDSYVNVSGTMLGPLRGLQMDRLEFIGLSPTSGSYYLLDDLTLSTSKTLGEKAAEVARMLVGAPAAPYLSGGKGWAWNTRYVDAVEIVSTGYSYITPPSTVLLGRGVDCSGLVMWAYNKAFGATDYRTGNPIFEEGAEGQWTDGQSDAIDLVDRRPGDLIFFEKWVGRGEPDHVALYLGNDEVIEATGGARHPPNQNATGVIISRVSDLTGRHARHQLRSVHASRDGAALTAE